MGGVTGNASIKYKMHNLTSNIINMDWTYFDKAFCITTIPIPLQRLRRLTHNMREVGLTQLEIVYHPREISGRNKPDKELSIGDIFEHNIESCSDGALCDILTKNHMGLIYRAYNEGAANVMILEDDAEFDLDLIRKYLPSITKWLKKNEWEIFNFGSLGSPFPLRFPVGKGVSRALNPLLMHCYALSRPGMERIIKAYETPRENILHADRFFANTFKRYYVADPAVCFQWEKPALYEEGIAKLPMFLRKKIEPWSFKDFCIWYERKARMLMCVVVVIVVGVAIALTLKLKRFLTACFQNAHR
jgi:hypothetical protein